jgi:hypothetical protein
MSDNVTAVARGPRYSLKIIVIMSLLAMQLYMLTISIRTYMGGDIQELWMKALLSLCLLALLLVIVMWDSSASITIK